jgi:hypothetical protein
MSIGGYRERSSGELNRDADPEVGHQYVELHGALDLQTRSLALMPGAGVEPARPVSGSRDFKSLASANSATPAGH